MYARITSLGIYGLDGYPVTVEADTSNGLPAFDIVGLPDDAVRESRERVRSSIKNCGFSFPVSRITVNLAPADKKKSGPLYDLPVLLSVLVASGQIETPPGRYAFIGELSLDGALRPIKGALSMALSARANGIDSLVLPLQNAEEAAVAEGLHVYGASCLGDILQHLSARKPLSPVLPSPFNPSLSDVLLDFADVKGQAAARRALEVAAAGRHNVLMIGPPGAGKSMLAKRLPTIMPPLSYEEAVETTRIYSVAGSLDDASGLITVRPFRSPHHTVSPAGLTGGGTVPRPGEISLAHNGVLFLDELPEFPRTAMEVLRQPIEDGTITLARASGSLRYPCNVMLVAAMNPCPCGNFGSPEKNCNCAPHVVERYLSKISGPLLDRLDLHVEVSAVPYDALSGRAGGESSSSIRHRVARAHDFQRTRFAGTRITSNAAIPPAHMAGMCAATPKAQAFLKNAFEHMGMSARAYDKVLKVARTIADLQEADIIDQPHVAEAIQYRALDKKYWNR